PRSAACPYTTLFRSPFFDCDLQYRGERGYRHYGWIGFGIVPRVADALAVLIWIPPPHPSSVGVGNCHVSPFGDLFSACDDFWPLGEDGLSRAVRMVAPGGTAHPVPSEAAAVG